MPRTFWEWLQGMLIGGFRLEGPSRFLPPYLSAAVYFDNAAFHTSLFRHRDSSTTQEVIR